MIHPEANCYHREPGKSNVLPAPKTQRRNRCRIDIPIPKKRELKNKKGVTQNSVEHIPLDLKAQEQSSLAQCSALQTHRGSFAKQRLAPKTLGNTVLIVSLCLDSPPPRLRSLPTIQGWNPVPSGSDLHPLKSSWSQPCPHTSCIRHFCRDSSTDTAKVCHLHASEMPPGLPGQYLGQSGLWHWSSSTGPSLRCEAGGAEVSVAPDLHSFIVLSNSY